MNKKKYVFQCDNGMYLTEFKEHTFKFSTIKHALRTNKLDELLKVQRSIKGHIYRITDDYIDEDLSKHLILVC